MSQLGYWDYVLSRVFENLIRLIERRIRPFLDTLESWISELLSRRLPRQWREQLHAYLDSWEPEGFSIKAEHRPVLENFIERWATSRGLLPLPPHEEQPVERWPTSTQTSFRRTATPAPGRPTQKGLSERFFNDKLIAAEDQLQEIIQSLESLAQKLDAAQLGEEVEVQAEVEAAEAAIWCYNDALESARDAWLRDDLDSDAMMRLYSMSSPASFGLPLFIDEQQAQRASDQELRINERMRQRNLTLDRIVLGMQIVEGAGTAAGLLLGGGVVLAAYKKGGKWAVAKTVAAVGAAVVADEAVESRRTRRGRRRTDGPGLQIGRQRREAYTTATA
ncbi:MAG: hypothetical protein AB7O59_17935 [Pirellulales bacterium]